MTRKLLATVTLALFLANGAYAQTPTPAPAPVDPAVPAQPVAPPIKRAEGYLASNLIGEAVYNSMGDDAETIGNVNDLILSPEGKIEAVVIGVGGFLGIGKKNVAIEYGLVDIGEILGDEVLVVKTTAEALKAQEEFDRAAYEPMPADADVKETKPATAEDLAKVPVEEAPAEGEEPITEPPADAETPPAE